MKSFLDVCQPLVQCAIHEHLSIHDEAVKDKEAWLLAAVGLAVPHELAVEDRVNVKGSLVAVEGKV